MMNKYCLPDSERLRYKGRTIRKVMGVGGGGWGWEKNKKKFMQGKIPRKKTHAKKKVKKKKCMQKEGPSVTFSESLSFFEKV